MSLIDLASQFRGEASHLTTKSLPPLGLDYRGRTKLERRLFAILREYCREEFAFTLGGVTYSHQKMFEEAARINGWTQNKVKPVRSGFGLSDSIRDIASSDPYVVEEGLGALGASANGVLVALEQKILDFLDEVVDARSQ